MINEFSFKKILIPIMTIVLCFCFVCTNVDIANAATVKLNKKSVVILKGKSTRIKVKNAGNKKIKFKSSNKKIAAVSKKGIIKARSYGKTKIIVKVGSKKLPCKVKVINPALNKTSITLVEGQKFSLKLAKAGGEPVKYSSNNGGIASVSSKGVVTAKKEGSTKIYAKVAGYSFPCTVKVKSKYDKYINAIIATMGKDYSSTDSSSDYRLYIITGSLGNIIIRSYLGFDSNARDQVSTIIKFNPKESKYADIRVGYYQTSGNTVVGGFAATASLDITKITKNGSYNFTVETNTGVSESTINKMSSSALNAAIAKTDLELLLNTGFGINKLGFTAY